MDLDFLDLAASDAFMAWSRRRRMKKAAIRTTKRRVKAPPMIPPISGLVRPLVGVPLAAVLETAVAETPTLGSTDGAEDDVAVGVGAWGVAAVMTVLVIVKVCDSEVVVNVSVKVKVVTSVE